MPRKKKPVVALFVDVPSLHQSLRSLHHRPVDAAQLRACAEAHGKLDTVVALADWDEVPSYYPEGFEAAEVERVQVQRKAVAGGGGRRREVVRDLVPLELFARTIELLFRDKGGEVDLLMIATADPTLARMIQVIRERFEKDVIVLGVEGAVPEALSAVATSSEEIPLPPVEPTNLEGIEALVPLLESLEQRKRYLNFKYIRESAVRKLELPEKSFESAERLLSEAIACGLLEKRKIEDKYKPGQHFTAYAIDRTSPWFERFGSGEPAPEHPEEPETKAAEPTFGRSRRAKAEAKPEGKAASKDEASGDEARDDDEGEGRGRKRRRRRRKKGDGGGSSNNGSSNNGGGNRNNGGQRRQEEMPAALAAGAGKSKKGRNRRKGQQNHNQDRVGRRYEAPSRFLDDTAEGDRLPNVSDDDIDEDKIMRALGNI